MIKSWFTRLNTRFLILAFLALSSCDSGSSGSSDVSDEVRALTIRLDDTQRLVSGSTIQLRVIARDERGAQLRDFSTTWRSSDPSIAEVDASGVVTALALGEVTITAQVGIAQATQLLRVWPNVPDEIAETTPVVFRGAHVLPMESANVLTNQTVVIQRGLISAIGPEGAVAAPANAEIIEAVGFFLMPGLVDMHTHVQSGATSDGANSLLLYLANGVTTILNMGDHNRDILNLRRQWEGGRLRGPNIYAAMQARGQADGGAFFTIVESAEQGRALVRTAKADGYDLIKVYNSISTAAFDAIVQEARANGLAVVGHGVREPGMSYLLNNGMVMVAHAEEFIYTTFNNQIATSRIAEVATQVAQTNAYLTATLSTFASITAIFQANQNGQNALALLQQAPETRFLAPQRIAAWQASLNTVYARSGNLAPQLRFQQQFLKAFHEAGVPLLLGTDSPGIPGLTPGFAIYDEMALLEETGLSTLVILQAGTKNAGAFFAEHVPSSSPFGTLAVGQRADLILLAANPLESLDNLQQTRLGVMANGRWYAEAHLQTLLEAEAN